MSRSPALVRRIGTPAPVGTASRAALAVLARVLLVVLDSLLGIACLTPVVIAEPLAPTSNDSHVTTYDYLVASRQGDNGTAPWRGLSRGPWLNRRSKPSSKLRLVLPQRGDGASALGTRL